MVATVDLASQWTVKKPFPPSVIICRLVLDSGLLSSGVYRGMCRSCGEPVKFWSVPGPVVEVKFNLNGSQYTVQNPDPHTSLNEWIRSQPGHQGWSLELL